MAHVIVDAAVTSYFQYGLALFPANSRTTFLSQKDSFHRTLEVGQHEMSAINPLPTQEMQT